MCSSSLLPTVSFVIVSVTWDQLQFRNLEWDGPKIIHVLNFILFWVVWWNHTISRHVLSGMWIIFLSTIVIHFPVSYLVAMFVIILTSWYCACVIVTCCCITLLCHSPHFASSHGYCIISHHYKKGACKYILREMTLI